MKYAGFWKRLAANLVDSAIVLPFFFLQFWFDSVPKTVGLASTLSYSVLVAAYNVCFVAKYGQTPGKMVVGIKIVKVDGISVSWKEAFLRDSVGIIFAIVGGIAMWIAISKIPNPEYTSLSWDVRWQKIIELNPPWATWVNTASYIWIWSEVIVLLFNKKKRALHDFIAGTVVIHKYSQPDASLATKIPWWKKPTGILMALLIVFVIIISSTWFFKYKIQSFFTAPAELESPRISVGSGFISRSMPLYKDDIKDDIGKITDIVEQKVDTTPGVKIGIAGTNGAVFIDKKFNIKALVKYDRSSSYINFIDVNNNGNFEFLNRLGPFKQRDASLIDHKGKTLWTYDDKDGVNDMVAGDMDGDGSTEFVVGFNGGRGIHLLDQNGIKKWAQEDGNVWHVEIVDINGDAKLEIVHSNSRGNIVIRDKHGNIISKKRSSVRFSHFHLSNWPTKLDRKYISVPEKEKICLLDFDGKIVKEFKAPNCYRHGDARGVPVKIKSNVPEYFAVLVEYSHWQTSILYLYALSGALAYQEIIPEACASIAAITTDDNKTEKLLIGCDNKVLQYQAKD